MIRLMIADDHSYLAEGVKQFLLNTDIEVVAHTLDVNNVISLYQSLKPDVLLCDIMFQQAMHGFDVVKKLLEIEPTAKVIMFSQYEEVEIVVKAYDIGAKAFLSKTISAKDLIDAIRKVNKGDVYFDEKQAVKLALYNHQSKTKEPSIEELLDSREIEVFRYLADGLVEKDIAEKLGLAPRTVSSIKIALKEKLKVHKPSEFTKLAIKHNLISININ